jgi:hypothetical protein
MAMPRRFGETVMAGTIKFCDRKWQNLTTARQAHNAYLEQRRVPENACRSAANKVSTSSLKVAVQLDFCSADILTISR